MSRLLRNAFLIFAVLACALISIFPVNKKLRLGKDLSGGASLVYAVQLDPSESPERVIPAIIEVLKMRVDPDGTSDITMTREGRDRIEITFPLPNDRVKALKKAYTDALAELDRSVIDASEFERNIRLPPGEREAAIERLAGGSSALKELLTEAAAAGDAATAARAQYDAARKELEDARAAGVDPARVDELTKKVDGLTEAVAQAELAYDTARDTVLRASMSSEEVRRALERSRRTRTLYDRDTKTAEVLPSPRDEALKGLKERYPDAESVKKIDELDRLHQAYLAERRSLDDPADLKRLISGAGVLEFRITVNPGGAQGGVPDEEDLRLELRERGPRNARHPQVAWFKLNKLDGWYDNVRSLRALRADPAAYFGQMGYVVEEYDGEYWMLCWTTADNRLTRAEGDWKVAGARETSDQQGRPAIGFEMDAQGGLLLGHLTGNHVGQNMAILLDDQVYTAPNLRSRIGKSGIIEGTFPPEEINYIQRTLKAGSLHAKLSPEPIGESTLGPELGADNLQRGYWTGIITFTVVAVFMVLYYFASGLIAVIALAFNFILVLAIMSLNEAAFTLPGIAGIVLTFGQAIDSNVLIYERMREEFLRGADMKTAVRLGFSRAFSSIVDGNVANLIICAVLYYFGTQEIRGFAITLGIGVVTTLFTALTVSRFIFTVFVEHLGWRRTSQLPMVFPALQRALTPRIDWMRLRWVFLGALAIFLVGSGVITYYRGNRLLDTEFLGGVQIDLQLRSDTPPMTRREVQERVHGIGRDAAPGAPVRVLTEAEVLPVNPQADGVTSDRFKIRAGVTRDDREVLTALVHRFSDVIESKGALTFTGAGETDFRRAPVYPILSNSLGEAINRPDVRDDVKDFVGGAAIILEGIDPP